MNYPIILNAVGYGGTDLAVSYSAVKFLPQGTISIVQATEKTEPEMLTISHQDVKIKGVPFRRSLVRLDKTKTDPLKGDLTASVYEVFNVPLRTAEFSDQDYLDMKIRLFLLTGQSANLAQILSGQH